MDDNWTWTDEEDEIWELASESFDYEMIIRYRERQVESGCGQNPSGTTKMNLEEYDEDDDDEEDEFAFCLPAFDTAREQAEQFVKKVLEASWNVTHFKMLPEWLQDNDYVCSGYRPPLPSFAECFKSIFRLHTETWNIWTHMIGCVVFLIVAVYYVTRPEHEIQLQEKLVFSIFFAGVVTCLGLSSMFHVFSCHSERVGKLVLKLDYIGITLLIICSFVPWLFYGFYCRREPKITYSAAIIILGIGCIIVSWWDKFSEPAWRTVRAGMFLALALSGVIPSIHYLLTDGFASAINDARFDWLMLMAFLYICGTVLYAMRIPERFFPGKFDIWFQSHQLFHLFVVVGALVHYRGISEMAIRRLTTGTCTEENDGQYWSLLTGSSS